MSDRIPMLIAAFFAGALLSGSPATAEQPPVGAACERFGAPTVQKRQDWMDVQLAAGRMRFVSIHDSGLCAW